MKSKITITLIMLGISLAMGTGLASAQEVKIELYVRTSKANYGYGEQGTLYVTVWNKGGAVDLKNIEVKFPWQRPTLWNYTTLETAGSIGKDEKKTYEIAFTVPSESRDIWTDNMAQVTLNYEVLGRPDKTMSSINIRVATSVYNENITLLYYLTTALTIAVIAVIIELYFVWRRLRRPTPMPTTA